MKSKYRALADRVNAGITMATELIRSISANARGLIITVSEIKVTGVKVVFVRTVAIFLVAACILYLSGCGTHTVRVEPITVSPVPADTSNQMSLASDPASADRVPGSAPPPFSAAQAPGPYPVFDAASMGRGIELCKSWGLNTRVQTDEDGLVRGVTCFPKGTDIELNVVDGKKYYREGAVVLPEVQKMVEDVQSIGDSGAVIRIGPGLAIDDSAFGE